MPDTQRNEWLDPGHCLNYRLRRTARMTAKAYDDALRPSGIRNTQFTLVAALQYLGETSIGALAETLATDSTTLTRNLDILVRRGFVEDVKGEDGRVRMARLTAAGKGVYETALPFWRQAQSRLLASLDGDLRDDLVAGLAKIEHVCAR